MGMKPVFAALTLNHQVIRIVWHFTLAVDRNSIRVESSSSGVILEAAEEILIANSIKFGVALEGVDNALVLNSISALHVIVVREENLLGTMELASSSKRLLWPIVPAHSDLNIPTPAIGFNALYLCHIRES